MGAGERLALVGPSGCGKSTLLNIASGLVRPRQGEVRLAGASLTAMSPGQTDDWRGRHVGFVFQGFHLLEPLSALENVLAGMRFGRAIARHEQRERAVELLGRVGLGSRLRHRPGELSMGERQRVALARAIAGRPAVILADEPTASLDPATGGAVLDLLLEMTAAEGAALLLVTHDEAQAALLPRRFDCRGLVTAAGEEDR